MLLSVFMFFMREFQVPTANSGSRRKIESYFIAEKVARRPIFAATILPAKLLHAQKECSCEKTNLQHYAATLHHITPHYTTITP